MILHKCLLLQLCLLMMSCSVEYSSLNVCVCVAVGGVQKCLEKKCPPWSIDPPLGGSEGESLPIFYVALNTEVVLLLNSLAEKMTSLFLNSSYVHTHVHGKSFGSAGLEKASFSFFSFFPRFLRRRQHTVVFVIIKVSSYLAPRAANISSSFSLLLLSLLSRSLSLSSLSPTHPKEMLFWPFWW